MLIKSSDFFIFTFILFMNSKFLFKKETLLKTYTTYNKKFDFAHSTKENCFKRNRSEVLDRISMKNNFTKFTGKDLQQIRLLFWVYACKVTLKELHFRSFPVNFAIFGYFSVKNIKSTENLFTLDI